MTARDCARFAQLQTNGANRRGSPCSSDETAAVFEIRPSSHDNELIWNWKLLLLFETEALRPSVVEEEAVAAHGRVADGAQPWIVVPVVHGGGLRLDDGVARTTQGCAYLLVEPQCITRHALSTSERRLEQATRRSTPKTGGREATF